MVDASRIGWYGRRFSNKARSVCDVADPTAGHRPSREDPIEAQKYETQQARIELQSTAGRRSGVSGVRVANAYGPGGRRRPIFARKRREQQEGSLINVDRIRTSRRREQLTSRLRSGWYRLQGREPSIQWRCTHYRFGLVWARACNPSTREELRYAYAGAQTSQALHSRVVDCPVRFGLWRVSMLETKSACALHQQQDASAAIC